MATPTAARIPTEFEAILFSCGYKDESERIKLADVLQGETIGISTLASVAGWEMGKLTAAGLDFVAGMTELINMAQAADTTGTLLTTAVDRNNLTQAVRAAIVAENSVQRSSLTALGVSHLSTTTSPHVVINGEHGETTTTAAEIAVLKEFEAVVNGSNLPDKLTPTKKMIVFFIRCVKDGTLWWFNLEYAICAFDATQRPRPQSNLADQLLKKKSDYDDIDPQNISRKVAVIYAIKLVMHALTIACSFIVSEEDAKTKYTGTTKYNVVQYEGKKTLVYGTRYMIEEVMTYVLEYGDNLSSYDLMVAFRESMRNAAFYVNEGALMNEAIVKGLRDARDEWKIISSKGGTGYGSRYEPATERRTVRASNNGGNATVRSGAAGKSPIRPPPADKPATVKGCCGAFNRREGCPNGPSCRNGEHLCHICKKPGHGASSTTFHPPGPPGAKRARLEAASTSGSNPATPQVSRMRETQNRTA